MSEQNLATVLDDATMDLNPAYLSKDETDIISTYRRAKGLGFADISISIQHGSRVKLWLTEKIK